jgi:hypothetical protein
VHYLEILRQLHDGLHPAAYLEIGVDHGDSLQLSRAHTIAIDPAPKPRPAAFLGKPSLLLAAVASDEFFARYDKRALLGETPLDFAFIDGLHEFAQVIRDLEHVERWAHPGTVVAIHDVLPRNPWEAAHAFHDGVWTGDVWRVVPFLREHRPDLRCWLTAAEPTGMLLVTNLDPGHAGMSQLADDADREFPRPGPDYDRRVEAFIAGAAPAPAVTVLRELVRLEQAPAWKYDTKWGMRLVAKDAYAPLLQLAADGAHTADPQPGLEAGLRLVNAFWLPPGVREQAYRHLAAYARPLASLWPGAAARPIDPPPGGAVMTAPSPVTIDGRLMSVVRLAALGNAGGGGWGIVWLADDLTAGEPAIVLDATGDGPPAVDSSLSLVRPIDCGGALLATVAVADRNPRGVWQTGLVTLADGELRNFRLLSDPALGRHEQGWAPFVAANALHVVSNWEPTEVLRVEAGTGAAERVALRPAPRLAERFRDASAGVPVGDGWLFLVNERSPAAHTGAEHVFARFVLLNHEFRITAATPQFWVASRGADEAAGLARQGDRLIAGFTSDGATAILAALDVDAVVASLMPLASPGYTPRGSTADAPA